MTPPLVESPYKQEFTVPTDLSPTSPSITELDPQPVIVDRWELVLSPAEYFPWFIDTLAIVQLVNRIPHRKMHTTHHRGPAFDHWLLLAQANHQLWIDPVYKDGFFDSLDQYQTAQPGTHPQQASLGNVHVSTTVFVKCPQDAGCDSLRLKAYGQKTPINDRFIPQELAPEDHRWAEHNEWDMGRSFSSPLIWLFGPATSRRHGIIQYNMLIPGSDGSGTCLIKVARQMGKVSVKANPRLVHVIKSFNSRHQGSVSKTMQGVRNQVDGCLRMIRSLNGKDDMTLCGFRIEVTVKAATLSRAREIVEGSGLLVPCYWLAIGDGDHSLLPLSVCHITREGILANANWVYDQADQLNIFSGSGSNKPTQYVIKALTYVLNSLGWNAGIQSPTHSANPHAW